MEIKQQTAKHINSLNKSLVTFLQINLFLQNDDIYMIVNQIKQINSFYYSFNDTII